MIHYINFGDVSQKFKTSLFQYANQIVIGQREERKGIVVTLVFEKKVKFISRIHA